VNIKQKYREAIAESLQTSPENIFLFWKGRVGLYALMKSMGIGEGDEVILPGFTCVVVPNACLYLGAKPVYIDIARDTMNMDVALIEKSITSKTKLIISQNTFGLPPDSNSIKKIASKYNIPVVEDCTHGYGGHYEGRPNGTNSIASFYSTQWNKPFSTGIGGFAWTNDSNIANRMKVFENEAAEPSFSEKNLLNLLIKVRKTVGNSPAYWTMLKAYRKLSKIGGFVGSSSDEELSGTIIPDGYLKKISAIQCREGISEIKNVQSYVEHRKNVAGIYISFLQSLRVHIPEYNLEHTFLKFPLLVTDRDNFFRLAISSNIELGDWFNSPIHPIEKEWQKWMYVNGSCPNSEYISSHIVNLPTHQGIDSKKLEAIKNFLTVNERFLIKGSGPTSE
jgi:perosamine synthetase